MLYRYSIANNAKKIQGLFYLSLDTFIIIQTLVVNHTNVKSYERMKIIIIFYLQIMNILTRPSLPLIYSCGNTVDI